MSDTNHFDGEITIKPALSWADIQRGPSVSSVRLRLTGDVTDTDTGQIKVVTASAIVVAHDWNYSEEIAADLQAVVDHYGAAHEFGGHIQAQWDPGYGFTPPQRFLVADGRVQVVTAQVSWPEVSE